ncbi:MAG: RNA recognition motif domain-containing protein [Candidatus Gracilibacteria bacterium]
MEPKLFVGGLPYSTTKEELHDAFVNAGFEVAENGASVIMNKMTGESKGFGFVLLANPAQVEDAIAFFDNKSEPFGRTVRVSQARPMEDRPRRSFGGGDRGGFGGGRRDFGGDRGGYNSRPSFNDGGDMMDA